MNSNEIKAFKNKIKLSDRQREIIIGLTLGDGCLETQSNGRTFRLKIEQSILHKEYVDWLFQELKNLVLTGPKNKTKRIGEKQYENYGFQTLFLGNLRFYAHQFYQENLRGKKIPRIIKKLLTPLGLAVWFMDDGQIKSKRHRTLLINTQCFSRNDLEILRETLKMKFGIETTLKKERTGFRIYILSKSMPNFLKFVSPYIVQSMRYKLGINNMPKR